MSDLWLLAAIVAAVAVISHDACGNIDAGTRCTIFFAMCVVKAGQYRRRER